MERRCFIGVECYASEASWCDGHVPVCPRFDCGHLKRHPRSFRIKERPGVKFFSAMEPVLFPAFVDEEGDHENGQTEDDVADFVAVFCSQFVNVLRSFKRGPKVDEVANQGKDDVPAAGAKRRVEQEWPHLHSGEACRERYELADARDEASEKR